MCPLEDTGMGSVKPWSAPKNIYLKISNNVIFLHLVNYIIKLEKKQ